MKNCMAILILATLGGSWVSPQSPEKSPDLSKVHNHVEISDRLTTSGQIRNEHLKSIQEAGFDVLVNLAPADAQRNGQEGFLAVEQGLTYVQIPVDWRNPSQRDLDLFFALLDANQDRKVYVHCFANMRVSVFVYLYRTLRQGVDEESAWKDVLKVWDPNHQEQWKRFIEAAKKRSEQ